MITPTMIEASREALATMVIGVLRQHARHSAHPADQRARRRMAAEIARALQAEFLVTARLAPDAEPGRVTLAPGPAG